MRRPSRPRKPASLSQSVHQQLNVYALAASAAGVGLLTLAQPAKAKIVYTPANLRITTQPGGIYNLDLNHDGKVDFTFLDKSFCTVDFCAGSLIVSGHERSNKVEGKTKLAYALTTGALISARRPFRGSLMASTQLAGFYYGYWVNVTDRYLGLKIRGRVHYGWARLSVYLNTSLGPVGGTLTGYAYETIPNKAIIAGKTKGADDKAQEPATLGRLALGRK